MAGQHSSQEGIHRLVASTKEFGLDLRLGDTRRPVLHGDHGYSRKGTAPGNASFYYSLTRMPTRGTVTIDGRAIEVTGVSWMDHEFGTTFLETDQVGWDWFSVQLDDGRDLMVFQLRRRGRIDRSTIERHTGGAGRLVPQITFEDGFALEPGRMWTSTASGGRYPVEWRVRIPHESIDVSVRAALDDQELGTGQSTGVTYWEGAIDVSGAVKGRPAQGRGYLEMTGYVAGRGLEALR